MNRFVCLSVLFLLCGDAASQERKPLTSSFSSPVKGREWKPESYGFGQDCSYPTEAKDVMKRWGHHLGEDMDLDAGSVIIAAGDGKVMYVGNHPGASRDKRKWGGVVILAHWITDKVVVFTLYGHLEIDPKLKKEDFVKQGTELGKVAPALSADNGWWEESHLHFQCNVDARDKYRGGLLQGYAERYTKEGMFIENDAPNRLLDHVAPTEVFKAKDQIDFLVKAEADPKRK